MTSSARRAVRVLEIINASDEPLGVSAIAEMADVLPGTAFRSLDALERCELVSRYRASTQYEVGPAASRLKQTVYAQFPVRNIALPFLRRMAFATSESVALCVPVGWCHLRLAVVTGPRALSSGDVQGIIKRLDIDIAGTAILSGYSDGDFEAFQNAYGNTLPADLHDRIEAAKKNGYVLDDPKRKSNCAIAFPVQHEGATLAAIKIDGPVASSDTKAFKKELKEWQSIITELQAELTLAGDNITGPFDHLPADHVTRLLEKEISD